ncbi:MAG: M15 family metallopeptidase [Pseudomonadota bacterium]|nr:M15 family metallopeptidase [Pseudomonadota bacterium]
MIIHVRNLGVPLWISSSTRTLSRQQQLVAAGASRTLRSKHLTGHAFDVDVLGFGRDEVPLWWWGQLAALGAQLGLVNGGRFTGLPDWGHFESRR